ncbi:MAG: CNNM domain-containing protein [Verrucomicrobiota bacterium]|nr:CNNM domain-containing protein [Verrucomicrobiota bacterium]
MLKNEQAQPVTALVQFTGHPCTCYHPEKPIVFGDWPQVACDMVASHLSPSKPLAVSFLQGCAGDVNSKGMFRGGVELSERYGRLLGESYIKALDKLQPSSRDGLDYAVEKVQVPLGPLPSEETLKAEIAEMEDFIRRASAGDENTLACVGLNFPTELTPVYRGKLIEAVLPWSQWALRSRQTGKAKTVPAHLEVEIYVLRLGDVGLGLAAPYAGTAGLVLVVLAITYLSLIVGELVPKRLALSSPERFACLLAVDAPALDRRAAGGEAARLVHGSRVALAGRATGDGLAGHRRRSPRADAGRPVGRRLSQSGAEDGRACARARRPAREGSDDPPAQGHVRESG